MIENTLSRGPVPSSGPGAIEVHSIDHIPETDRHGKVWHQGPFWFLGNFQPFTVALGFIGPSLGLSLGWTIVASALGVMFGTFFVAFHASQGPWLGLPQMIQSRAQLGYRGVIVALAGTLFTFVGFNVIDVLMIHQGLEKLFGWNGTLVGVSITAIAVVLAIYGHDWLHRVFRVLFFLALPLWLMLTGGILAGRAGGTPMKGGVTLAAFMGMFSVAASYNVTYAPTVSDYTRYLPRDTRPWRLIASVFWGASGAAIWLIAIGAWMASRLGVTDPLVGIRDAGDNVVGGMGGILLVLSVLALVAAMGFNAYCGMLTVLTGVDALRPLRPTLRARVVTVVVLAAVWAIVGVGLITNFSAALTDTQLFMLYLLAPWTAVNLVDYFFVRRGHYAITHLFTPDGIYGAWAWRGITSYAVGLLASVPFVALSFYAGPAARALGGVDVAFVVGMAFSGGVYYAFTRSLDVAAEGPHVAASERELSGDGRGKATL
jgi:nucleobase:cation symporter-1, NCS1 family